MEKCSLVKLAFQRNVKKYSVVCSGCLDTLAAMQELKMGVASAEEETQAVMKVFSKEDYSVVNRFESK